MGLLDEVIQTVESAANTAVEVGQNLGAQAQVQLNIKKLQLERARKQHDLGGRSYEAHQSGALTSGPTAAMTAICAAMDALNAQIAEQEQKLQEIKAEAAQRAAAGSTTTAAGPGPTVVTEVPVSSDEAPVGTASAPTVHETPQP